MPNHRTITIPILLSPGAEVPSYASSLAAGVDIRAHLSNDLIIEPGESALIPTGVKVAVPEGFEIQVRPRSGLAYKYKVTVLNTPGTIDADYRGEIGIILINHGKNSFIVTPGMRIAQLVVAPVIQAIFKQEISLSSTERGEGGFGHTGTQ